MIVRTLIPFHRHSWRCLSSTPSLVPMQFHSEMKKLVDSRQFEKALNRFYQQSKIASDPTITLALKVSAILRDYQSGVRIHRQLSKESAKNPWIQTSLIHFYMQCNDVPSAEKLFSSIEQKTVFMYGSMFKGYITNGRFDQAIELFQTMPMKPDRVMILLLLNACAKNINANSIRVATNVLEQYSSTVFADPKLIDAAIDMLMKSGQVKKAEDIFRSLNNRNLSTCQIMMQGYLDQGMPEKTLDLFETIRETPDDFSYRIAFSACCELDDNRAIDLANKLLRQLPAAHRNNVYLLGSILKMLMKFGQVKEAEQWFRSSTKKSLISYSTMIKGYIDNGLFDKAFDLFENILEQADEILYMIVINGCTKACHERAIQLGNRLLKQTPKIFKENVGLMNSLLQMLMKFGQVKDAEDLFRTLKKKNHVLYGAMIKGYMQNKLVDKASNFLNQMGEPPDDVLLTIVFNSCADLRNESALQLANKLLHSSLSDRYKNQLILSSTIIKMLMKFGRVTAAENVFQSLGKKDIITYGATMKGYVENNLAERALDTFDQMREIPDHVIFSIIFSACAALCNDRAIQMGKRLLDRMPIHQKGNTIMISSALNMLMKFGQVKEAEDLYQSLKSKDIMISGAMIKGYVENNLPAKALDLFEQQTSTKSDVSLLVSVFAACAAVRDERAIRLGNHLLRQMPKNSEEHVILISSAINMLMKFGQVKEAENLFSRVKRPDAAIYGIMMHGYNHNNQARLSLTLMEQMKQQGVRVNCALCLALIQAAALIGMRPICEEVIKDIPVEYLNDQQIKNALIDMWGKALVVDEAKKVFQSCSQPDTFSYNTMINTYGRSGMGLEAVALYWTMPEELKDPISHICVINACSHAGLIDQARKIYEKIQLKSEKIVTTMVDCLSRMFMFDEALNLIDEYERLNSPSAIMYTALLSAARSARQSDLAKRLYNRMQSLFSGQRSDLISASILLSNTYASLGDYERAHDIRDHRLKNYGDKVEVGMTWTVIDGRVWEFKAHDTSNPQSSKIYAKIDEILRRMKEHGYEPDRSWITRPLQNDETSESVLCGHSERLAIAFNLIQDPPPKFIYLTKNLRICPDCHHASKLIAKIYQCDIIARDANRGHHFYPNGQCSCSDHF